MKTKVIHLERFDDVLSVSDKIAWGSANRLLLVWPRRGRVLHRPLDLQLILRSCQRLGVQLACVADDPDVLDHALELGIPVFRSVTIAQRLPWRRLRKRKLFEPRPFRSRASLERLRENIYPKRKSWIDKQIFRWITFIACSLAMFALVMIVYPETQITIAPAIIEQSLEIDVTASPEITRVGLSGGMPAEIIRVEVEGQRIGETSGSILLGSSYATGQVMFTNLTDQEITIPSGTIILKNRDPQVRFRTIDDVRLQPFPGARTQARIRAVEAGSFGNVGAEEIKAVEGVLGGNVAVVNPEATMGGDETQSRAPTEEDYQLLKRNLISSLEDNAVRELQQKKGENYRMIVETLSTAIIDEIQEPKVWEPGDRMMLTLRIEFKVWVIREDDLVIIGRNALQANLPSGSKAVDGSLRITNTTVPKLVEDKVNWKIRATQKTTTMWDGQDLIRAIAGRPIEQAKAAISETLDVSEPPLIDTTPSWWPLIPILPGRIFVNIK